MKSLETLIDEQRIRVASAAEKRREAYDHSGWNPGLIACACWNFHEAFKAWQLEVETLAMLEKRAH